MTTIFRMRSVVTSLLAMAIALVALVSPEAALASGAGWQGEYFANGNLLGIPRLVRQDGQIDFNWGSGSPAASLPADYFSVRWTRSVYFQAGRYGFTTETDDGVRLFVDNLPLVDEWRQMAPTLFAAEVDLTSGWHTVRMEYYEAAGGAMARLSWAETEPEPQTGWRGDYYGNRWLSGAPAFARYDDSIDFNWGTGRPDPRLQSDNFSVRWTRDVYFRAGQYRFTTETDDGVRLYVDRRLIINEWQDMAPTKLSAKADLTSGWHSVRMEYYEATGGALARLSWAEIEPEPQTGWRGDYYGNRWLAGAPAFARYDASIDFNWGTGRPDPRLQADDFSVRWTRNVHFEEGRYLFSTETDDGVRLWVDGILVIDQWRDMAPTELSAEVDLTGGRHSLRMEYYEAGGGALARLSWTKVLTPDEPITDWRGEYFGNDALWGAPQFVRNDEAIDFDWGAGRPDRRLAADGFSVRWTRQLHLEGGLYRFTVETDDGVRLYIDGRRVIDQWRIMSLTKHTYETHLSQGVHTIRMDYFERSGRASAKLAWEGPLPLPNRGNLITLVPPYPSYSWIKVYQLTGENTWQDVNPRGWSALSADGTIKIDGLPVDYARYGDRGHPYRVEQWVNGTLVQAVGDTSRGQA
ncbi:MAG TPA: PA14 domain-containing protein, partial [Anaerolineae bacterium]|nr:PA14 domain-containing protein [Anaerolineae bacterium]